MYCVIKGGLSQLQLIDTALRTLIQIFFHDEQTKRPTIIYN